MTEPAADRPASRTGLLIAFLSVVVLAPLVGAFVFSPLLVAWEIQPYPLAASLGVMVAEAITILILAVLVRRTRS